MLGGIVINGVAQRTYANSSSVDHGSLYFEIEDPVGQHNFFTHRVRSIFGGTA